MTELHSFPDTRWTLIASVATADSRRQQALEDLCRIYWNPLYAFARTKGLDEHAAKDLTQDLFLKFLSHDSFGAADPAKGKLRTFLLTAMSRLLANQHRKKAALKRAPEQRALSVEDDPFEAQLPLPSDDPIIKRFDRRWAAALLSEVELRLEREFSARNQQEQFALLKPHLLNPTSSATNEQIAQLLHVTPGAVSVALYRLRKRYKTILREEVQSTLSPGDDPEEELHHLYLSLQH